MKERLFKVLGHHNSVVDNDKEMSKVNGLKYKVYLMSLMDLAYIK
jgi:hypothetical protein